MLFQIKYDDAASEGIRRAPSRRHLTECHVAAEADRNAAMRHSRRTLRAEQRGPAESQGAQHVAQRTELASALHNILSGALLEQMSDPDALKSRAVLDEKLVRVALDCAGRSTDITTRLSKQALPVIGELA